MFKFISCACMALLLTGCAATPSTGADSVFVDQTQAYYTVYAGIPDEKLAETRARLTKAPPGVELIPLGTFKQNLDRYINSRILRDDYPGSETAAGILALVQKFPEKPIGLTWNGGIAISFNDFRYAKRLYARYNADPAQASADRTPSSHPDPLNPRKHLASMLGW